MIACTYFFLISQFFCDFETSFESLSIPSRSPRTYTPRDSAAPLQPIRNHGFCDVSLDFCAIRITAQRLQIWISLNLAGFLLNHRANIHPKDQFYWEFLRSIFRYLSIRHSWWFICYEYETIHCEFTEHIHRFYMTSLIKCWPKWPYNESL